MKKLQKLIQFTFILFIILSDIFLKHLIDSTLFISTFAHLSFREAANWESKGTEPIINYT